MNIEVSLEIPKDIHSHTRRDVSYKGKVYVVEVRAKLKDLSPSWPLVFLIADSFAGLAFALSYMRPPAVWPVDPNYIFGAIVFIAAILITIIVKTSNNIQVTDP